jgi:hypothetical protein
MWWNKFINLFRREPDLDIDKELGKLLQALPVCSQFVAIISKRYNDNDYKCEVIVEALKLFPWAQNHSKGVFYGDVYEQVANLALPYLLATADVSDDRITYLPPIFRPVFQEYVLLYFNSEIAQFYCHICQEIVEVKTEKLKLIDSPCLLNWTDLWTCERGHVVHKRDEQIDL